LKKKIIRRVGAVFLGVSLCVSYLDTVVPLVAAEETTSQDRLWDFTEGTQGWVFDGSWAGDGYHGTSGYSHDLLNGRLQVDIDFSQDSSNGWSQPGISFSNGTGIDYSKFSTLTFDFFYDSTEYTTGQITLKANSGSIFQEQMVGLNNLSTEDIGENIKKATVTFKIDPTYAKAETPEKLMLLIVGNNTDYKGSLWFDNIRLSSPVVEDSYVDATVTAESQTNLLGQSEMLTINNQIIPYAESIQLTDSKANDATKALYQYLKAVGESNAVIYGHMEDTVLKAGTNELTYSDTKDLTGSISGINGLDCGNLFEGFAEKYNNRHPQNPQIPENTEGNIRAAALFTNETIEEGGVMTLSAHMPNFAFATTENASAEKTYDRYDYTPADSYNLKGNTMNQILPGGQYHEQFTAYLDMIAEYAKQVDGPILFRPFHENTGSWFWWGKAFSDTETYKSVFKYTVEYLRDIQNVHNLLYVYGPGSEAATLDEYGERYPGDDYVDMIGFDTYDSNPVPDEEGYSFQTNFENSVKLTDTFAKQHGKLFAVTEIGILGMQDSGNRRPYWFTEILDILSKDAYDCSFFMTWTNYSDKSFYTPYVASVNEDGTLHGHELMDPFIEFYNNKKSIFASDQKAALSLQPIQPIVMENGQISGYFTQPIAGTRILEETLVNARLNMENTMATISVSNGTLEIPLDTHVDGKVAGAVITNEILAQLGESVNGKIILYADNAVMQEIPILFNIPEKEKDALLVDDFESYFGESTLLNSSWAVNKDSGSNLVISLSTDNVLEGDYSLEFSYDETVTGWAGITMAKEADWSTSDALQFWVVPDGKNQKTVIQINTADGGSYEAYLNNYKAYASVTEALLVTLPFSEFLDKRTQAPLTSEAASQVTNIGLWMNAIGDSAAIKDGRVSGTIYYDKIMAVSSESIEASFQTREAVSIDEMTIETLENAVDDANGLVKKEYTKESWKAFKVALKNAEKLIKNESAEKEALWHTLESLQDTIEDLVKIN